MLGFLFSLFMVYSPENASTVHWSNPGKTSNYNTRLIGGWFSGPDYAVFVSDLFTFIGDGRYLKILNVNNISNPECIGEYVLPVIPERIFVRDTFAYVADGNAGLRIINIADPAAPYEAGYFDTDGYAKSIYVVDSFAYVADKDSGMRIINIKDPSKPVEIGYYITDGRVWDVFPIDTLAYVAYNYEGMLVINVKDPENPVKIGIFNTGGAVNDMFVVDTIAYVTKYQRGMVILNVSNPAAPDSIGFYSLSNININIFVQDTIAYITGGGLKIVNVSNPYAPVEAGFYSTPNGGRGIFVKDTLVFVADGEDGMYIIQYPESTLSVEQRHQQENHITVFSGDAISVRLSLARSSDVSIEIFNILGDVVYIRKKSNVTGIFETKWYGIPGIYFVKTAVDGKENIEKAILIR